MVVVVTIAAAIVSARLNLSEALLRWTRPLERFQVDEIPGVLLVLAVCLMWFSIRRYREARQELRLRRRAEEGLISALADNRRLGQQYLEIQESERRAIARDLHDELGQYLNALKVDAVTLRDHLAPVDPAGHRAACESISTIDRVQRVVMGLIRQLRPVGLDELGLAAALEHCVDDWRRRLPNVAIRLDAADDLEGLDEMSRLALYRFVQEALTNVARHSRATRVEIRTRREDASPSSPARITVCIEDDGVGADLTRPGAGLGLIGMRERMEAIGGSLLLQSRCGRGFMLHAHVPLGHSQGRAERSR